MVRFLTKILFATAISSTPALAHNAQTNLNLFSPNSQQRSYSRVEGAQTLNPSELALSLFFDSGINTLAIYNNPSLSNDDQMNFAHLGVFLGLTPKIEIGARFPFLINQSLNPDQIGQSIRLYESGFTDSIGYAKYKLLETEKHGVAFMGQVAKSFSKNVFYDGESSGHSFMINAIYERFFSSWAVAFNVGYIKRSPGSAAASYVYFEPIDSTIIASLGISRKINDTNNVSLEFIHTQNQFDIDQSDRKKRALEASLSYRKIFKNLTFAIGLGAGLQDGVSEPETRGFAGINYRFTAFDSFKPKKSSFAEKHETSSKVFTENSDSEEAALIATAPPSNEDQIQSASNENDSNAMALVTPTEEQQDSTSEDNNAAAIAGAGTNTDDTPASSEDSNKTPMAAAMGGLADESDEELQDSNDNSAAIVPAVISKIYKDKVYPETVQIDEKDEPKAILEEFTKENQSSAHTYQKIVIEHVEFEFDSYQLDSSSTKILDSVVDYLKNTEYQYLKIVGHTDFYGSTLYNENLSLKRAITVLKYLRDNGIDVKQMQFDGYGKRRPLNTGISEFNRKKNRRVEIIIRKKQ